MTDIITRIVVAFPKHKYDGDHVRLIITNIISPDRKTLLLLKKVVDANNYGIYEIRCDLPNMDLDFEFNFPDINYAFGSLNYDDHNHNHVNQWHRNYCFPEDGEKIYSVTILCCGAINVFTRPMGG